MPFCFLGPRLIERLLKCNLPRVVISGYEPDPSIRAQPIKQGGNGRSGGQGRARNSRPGQAKSNTYRPQQARPHGSRPNQAKPHRRQASGQAMKRNVA